MEKFDVFDSFGDFQTLFKQDTGNIFSKSPTGYRSKSVVIVYIFLTHKAVQKCSKNYMKTSNTFGF